MKRNSKLILFSTFVILNSIFLTSCNTEELQENLSQVGDKIFPNVWAFLAQFLALVVLILAVTLLGHKSIKKFLDKRQEMLNDEVKKTHEANAVANKNITLSETILKDSKDEADEIIVQAKEEAKTQADIILDKAQKEASITIENAKIAVQKEKEQAKEEIKNEIVDVAFEASEKVLQREINQKDNKKIIDDFIKELEESD